MSAILDALKKLETEVESGSADSWPQNGAGGLSRAAAHIHARPVFLIAAGIVLFFLFGAVVWQTAVLVTAGQNPAAAANASGPQALQTEKQPAEEPEDFSVKYPAVFESEESLLPIKTRKQEKPGDPAKAKPVTAAVPQSGTKSGTESESESASGSKSGPEILRDKSLTLHAVSWSVSPQKRFAVINGRICREGERIRDYRIRSINADEVLLSDGAERRRLVFNKR
ncbi:MAG: hypothetical protein ACLFMN_01895 [Desulfobacterales bacterium]